MSGDLVYFLVCVPRSELEREDTEKARLQVVCRCEPSAMLGTTDSEGVERVELIGLEVVGTPNMELLPKECGRIPVPVSVF